MSQEHPVTIRARHELTVLSGVSPAELARLCDCQPAVIRRFVDIGLLEPLTSGAEPFFDTWAVLRVRKALRLKRDLRLNLDAVALVMELLDRIEELERSG